MVKKVFLVLLVLTAVLFNVSAQSNKNHWVDSVFNSLGIDERIGQLFMINVPPHASDDALKEIEGEIKSHEIGGIIKNLRLLQYTVCYAQYYIGKILAEGIGGCATCEAHIYYFASMKKFFFRKRILQLCK